MSESIKILNNIRTLRAQAREFSLETLDEMLEKLDPTHVIWTQA